MFVVKKLITPFLLPPGVFTAAVLVMAGICWRRRRRRGAVLFLLAGIVLWLPALDPVADWLHRGLVAEFETKGAVDPKGDVIVLLGGGSDDRARDLTGTGIPVGEMMVRIVMAVRLQRRLGVPVIVSGGAVYGSPISEAAVARRFLVDLGVPKKQVLLEEKSRDTFENASRTREICRQKGFRAPLLVTSDYHMKRAVATFRRAGLPVTPVPTRFGAVSPPRYGWWAFLPKSYEKTASFLKEYIGLAYYRLMYF